MILIEFQAKSADKRIWCILNYREFEITPPTLISFDPHFWGEIISTFHTLISPLIVKWTFRLSCSSAESLMNSSLSGTLAYEKLDNDSLIMVYICVTWNYIFQISSDDTQKCCSKWSLLVSMKVPDYTIIPSFKILRVIISRLWNSSDIILKYKITENSIKPWYRIISLSY